MCARTSTVWVRSGPSPASRCCPCLTPPACSEPPTRRCCATPRAGRSTATRASCMCRTRGPTGPSPGCSWTRSAASSGERGIFWGGGERHRTHQPAPDGGRPPCHLTRGALARSAASSGGEWVVVTLADSALACTHASRCMRGALGAWRAVPSVPEPFERRLEHAPRTCHTHIARGRRRRACRPRPTHSAAAAAQPPVHWCGLMLFLDTRSPAARRRADDHYQFLSRWMGHANHNCLNFDQVRLRRRQERMS